VTVYHGGTTGNPAIAFSWDDVTAKAVGSTPPPPNAAPAAAFTVGASGLTANVDGTGSADGDGVIASYAWGWGDSTPAGSGATASHTYAAAGTYTVTLTVTDDDGATATVTHDVTVAAPPPVGDAFAQDDFGRTATASWGSAPVGGAWTSVGTASRLSVAGGRGVLTIPPGGTVGAFLGSVVQTSSDVTATLSADRLSTGTSFATLQGRRVGNDAYGARVRLAADGSVQLHATREVAGTTTAVAGGVVTGLTFAPNDQLLVRTQVQGVSPTTVRVKVWKAGTTEPTDWRATITDTTASLQAGGGVGVTVYHGGTTGNPAIAFSWDDLTARPVQ
jgi:PKD repeat protein